MADINAITNGLRALAERVENVAQPQEPPPLPTLAQLNANYARAALALYNGNKRRTAMALDIDVRTLGKLLRAKAA
jgi:DNA-binding NtrC family response regulator